ncbi:protein kinase C-binding protein NELL2a isoform X3 [Gouania willdenowi]|uniref:Protein kinase C-binding protein NELL2 n=1 Tax=Gouania willdenowi TaxID=441366 RepID=A0A8C5G489_GOUWI|nr:protein kinase C-binding protein NELL2 isoform X3 [Gouania willdenowi]
MGLLRCLLAFCVLCPASGFGVDPTLRISILDELMLPQSFDGVTQVQGFHGQSRAFLFQGSSRDVKAAAEVAKRMVQKLRGKNEFTVLVTLKQDYLNSGVIFSIHHSEHRFLELESSGQRNEVRLHYRTKGQQDHTEVFPYSLADNQWHKVSVAVSASHVILHVDCNRIYERVVEAPYMDIPGDTLFWLGQRNSAHGLFKGVMQDVEILVMPQGYISQCPDLNRTCPTCNDFHGLVQKIMELQDVLAKTSRKLSRAEEKMNALDGCYCERTCNISGVVYREDEGWTDGCMNCTCTNGSVHCETISCPPAQCPAGTTPTYVKGVCCKECQPVCLFGGREVVDGDMKAVRDSTGRCLLFECRDRTMHQIVSSEPCPELNCPEAEQITLSDRCCKICQGHDFCSEGHGCVEHSDCVNLEAGDCCVCKDGFRPLREDNAYCEDIDECAEGKHYCRENTMCVNTPGSFMCICLTGYIRIDDYSCTEHDVCLSGLHNCDENALCLNIVGGHSCSCKPGYMGNGTVCKDINECAEGFIECDSKSTCVNLPGWYHCECRDGYHDNGFFSANGESCVDINECKTGRNTCTNDTVCFNLEGSYDCRCPHGHNCTGDCIHDNKVKHSGQIWILDSDRCSVCSCQAGQVMCRRMVCDCNNPNADLYCCPECDPRLSSQCLHQNGLLTYSSGDTWVENCQQCQCLQGQVDCWPLSCPPGDCEFTVVPEGECCPRCVTDPCQADTIRNDITKTCSDEHNISRFSGSSWIKHGTECTLCQCKNGHICCSVDPMCL